MIWVSVVLARAGHRQPARQPRRPGHPRAARRRHGGGELRRGHRAHPHARLRLRRRAGGARRLALRAHAARGEPDAVRTQRQHRVPAHGRDRRRRARSGRARSAPALVTVVNDALQDVLPRLFGTQRQFRNDRLRHPARALAAARARRPLAASRPRRPLRHRTAIAPPGRPPLAAAPDAARAARRCSRCAACAAASAGWSPSTTSRFALAAGEIVGLIGPERRRQEHDVQPAHRRLTVRTPARSLSSASSSTACARPRSPVSASPAASST